MIKQNMYLELEEEEFETIKKIIKKVSKKYPFLISGRKVEKRPKRKWLVLPAHDYHYSKSCAWRKGTFKEEVFKVLEEEAEVFEEYPDINYVITVSGKNRRQIQPILIALCQEFSEFREELSPILPTD